MKGITRAIAAVTLTVTLAACGADPLGPGGEAMAPPPAANLTIGSLGIGGTAPTSTSCGSTSVSESSTYVVAYGETTPTTTCSTTSGTAPTACGSTGMLSSASTYVVAYGESCTVAPAPSDSTPLKLSFP
jgi:hypothetical protein